MDIFDPPKFIECNIDDPLDVSSQIRKLRCFIFRGHRVSSWKLSSSFERVSKTPKITDNRRGREILYRVF